MAYTNEEDVAHYEEMLKWAKQEARENDYREARRTAGGALSFATTCRLRYPEGSDLHAAWKERERKAVRFVVRYRKVVTVTDHASGVCYADHYHPKGK